MVKEYIDQLSEENQEELDRLEKQMRDYLDELTYAQEWHENLQTKNNSQTNIFSPRSFDEDLEQSLENVKNKIARINQQIESTRELIETHMKKKMEYQTLLQEFAASSNNNNGYGETASIQETEPTDANTASEIVSIETDATSIVDIRSEKNSSEFNRAGAEENIYDRKTIQPTNNYTDEEVKTFLNEIYKKCEISMALLGNKNRCKTELNNMKHMIRDFVEKYK
jgi:hypothetical protein